MPYSDDIEDQLDRFAMGQMDPGELAHFQQKMKDDEALAADAIFRADMVQALRDIDLRNQLREEERRIARRRSFILWFCVAALAVALTALLVWGLRFICSPQVPTIPDVPYCPPSAENQAHVASDSLTSSVIASSAPEVERSTDVKPVGDVAQLPPPVAQELAPSPQEPGRDATATEQSLEEEVVVQVMGTEQNKLLLATLGEVCAAIDRDDLDEAEALLRNVRKTYDDVVRADASQRVALKAFNDDAVWIDAVLKLKRHNHNAFRSAVDEMRKAGNVHLAEAEEFVKRLD